MTEDKKQPKIVVPDISGVETNSAKPTTSQMTTTVKPKPGTGKDD
jgi:hypothetical protein